MPPSFHGAKAQTAVFHSEILPSVVKLKCFVLHPAENASVISQLSFGGAKASIAAFHPDILQLVVRRLRATHRKLSLSDSTVCAFAPLEKRSRSVLQ